MNILICYVLMIISAGISISDFRADNFIYNIIIKLFKFLVEMALIVTAYTIYLS